MTINDKKEILQLFKNQIEEKISNLKSQISDLALDAQNDAKGSAGDKHETGLAMMHLEQEKLSAKLSEAIIQQQNLNNISAETELKKVTMGSLVQTSIGYFFVCEPLIQLNYLGKSIFPISVNAPIYQMLKDKKATDTFTFNSKNITVLTVV